MRTRVLWENANWQTNLERTSPLSQRMAESTGPNPITHFFSVDVEEYFQVSAFERHVARESWTTYPDRLLGSMDWILDALGRRSMSGTFFTLGWIAQHRPGIVRRIADAGHEVASHGFWHRRVTTMTPDEFREDVRTSKDLLEQLSGKRVLGFRAPTFSIVPGHEWALEILAEEGYIYDSSLFPVARSGYGYPNITPAPHRFMLPNGETILELPMTMARVLGAGIPASGGGWFRQFPYAITHLAFAQRSRAGVPAMFYIHPWEIDPSQPRMQVSWLTRMRHYRGLDSTRDRLNRLLDEFNFTSVEREIEHLLALSSPAGAVV